jgi:hypothetical protein
MQLVKAFDKIALILIYYTITLQVLGAHIVKGLDLSSSDFTDGKTFKTINNFTLTIRKFNEGIVPSNTVNIRHSITFCIVYPLLTENTQNMCSPYP